MSPYIYKQTHKYIYQGKGKALTHSWMSTNKCKNNDRIRKLFVKHHGNNWFKQESSSHVKLVRTKLKTNNIFTWSQNIPS